MEFKPIKSDSGNIIESAYDEATKKCRVRFKSGLYENTKPIEPEVFKAFEDTFQKTDSSGSHFHRNLKQFEFKKIG